MDELLNWLRLQKGGVRTYLEFQNRALDLRAAEPDHAALLRLLGDLSGRFADAYDGEPLAVDVAAAALDRLGGLLEQAIGASATSPVEYLALLNELGRAELA